MIKIEPKELRIGNWIQHTNGEIYQSTEYTQLIIMRDGKDFMPVPITEQWLLRFGFDKCLNGFWDSTDYINVRVDPISFYLAGSDIDLANDNFKYVHQLQNLYFALTGNELVIQK